MIFTGLFLAALRAAGMIWQQGSLWMRMERIGTFIIRSGREGKLLEYPGREDKRNILRLGPWLFLGIVYGWLEDISEEVREDEKDHGSLRRGSVLCGTAF